MAEAVARPGRGDPARAHRRYRPGNARSVRRAWDGEDWRRSAATYEQWVADPNVYGGLIRQAGPGLLSTIRDARAWVDRFNRRHAEASAELADFYRLVWTIDRFSKPTVALLDGEVSWSDFCLVRHGTHKVVGSSFQLSFAAPGGLVHGCRRNLVAGAIARSSR